MSRRQQVEEEIGRLELLLEPTTKDLEHLEALQTELAQMDIEGEGEESSKSQKIIFRPLRAQDLRILREFLFKSSNFENLSASAKVDRVVLVLMSACGYGSVNEALVRHCFDKLSLKLNLDIKTYWQEQGSSCYISVGQESFKMSHAYMKKIATEELALESREIHKEEEPIRKKVAAKQNLTTHKSTHLNQDLIANTKPQQTRYSENKKQLNRRFMLFSLVAAVILILITALLVSTL